MTDRTYLLIQGWTILILSCVDGLTALIAHPGWFQ